jgi:hypothetical protein
MLPTQLLLVFLGGLVGYFYSSMVGGLSLVSVPLLLFVGLSPLQAIATNITSLVVPMVIVMLNYRRHGKLVVRPLMPLLAFFVVGSLLGANVVLSLEEKVLEALIAVFLVLALTLFLLKQKINLVFLEGRPWLEAIFFTLIGAYKSIFGASAKTFTMIVLSTGRGMDLVKASAASTFLLFFSVIVAASFFVWNGVVEWSYFLALTAGCSIGAFLGSGEAVKRGSGFVGKVLLVVLVFAALKTLFF